MNDISPPRFPAQSPSNGVSAGQTATTLTARQPGLADTARNAGLSQVDVEAAVDSGVLSGMRAAAAGSDVAAIERDADAASSAVAEASAHTHSAISPSSPGPADYGHLGAVIPVLPGSPGAGASTVAAVLTDALQMLSWRVLLADTADIARSGLASAVTAEGPVDPGPHEAVRIRFSWRGQAVLARAETSLPQFSPGMVPPPAFWVPSMGAPQVTVVDLSYDAWRMAAQPLSGPGAWLRAGQPVPRPVVVVRPSRPSLALAEQALARWEPWITAGIAASPAALVVVGARRWPGGVVGAAGRRVSALLDRAIFLPYLRDVATGGVGADITPVRLRHAMSPLLQAWQMASARPSRTRAARFFVTGGFR